MRGMEEKMAAYDAAEHRGRIAEKWIEIINGFKGEIEEGMAAAVNGLANKAEYTVTGKNGSAAVEIRTEGQAVTLTQKGEGKWVMVDGERLTPLSDAGRASRHAAEAADDTLINLNMLQVTRRKLLLGAVLARQKVSIMGAVSGIGKSTICIALAMAIAAGRKKFGLTPHEGSLRVGYLSTEDETEEVQRLVAAQAVAGNWRDIDIEDRLHAFGYDKLPDWFKFITINGQTRQPEIDPEGLKWLKNFIRTTEADVFIIDPLYGLSGGFELSPQMMNLIANALKAMAQECNMAILLVHHMRKGSNPASPNVEDISGGLSLVIASRATVIVRRLTQDEVQRWGLEPADQKAIRVVTDGKASLGPDGGRFFLRIDPVTLKDYEAEEDFEVQAASEWWPPETTSGFNIGLWRKVVEKIDAEEFVLFAPTNKKNSVTPTLSQIIRDICDEDFAENGDIRHDAKTFEQAIRDRKMVVHEEAVNPNTTSRTKAMKTVISQEGRDEISG